MFDKECNYFVIVRRGQSLGDLYGKPTVGVLELGCSFYIEKFYEKWYVAHVMVDLTVLNDLMDWVIPISTVGGGSVGRVGKEMN